MYMLLNNDHQIMISIIQTLNKPDLKSHLLEEIALLNNLSLKTTLKYLIDLENQYPHFITYNKNSKSASTKLYSLRIENEILRSYLKESTDISILLDIAFYPEKSIEQRCTDFWISTSTYQRIHSRIKHFLEIHEMRLEKKGSQLMIIGNSESYVSKFISCLYLEVNSLKYPDNLNVYPGLKELIASCLSQSGFIVDDISLLFSFTFALVYIKRVKYNLNPTNTQKLTADLSAIIEEYVLNNSIETNDSTYIMQSIGEILLNSNVNDLTIVSFDIEKFSEVVQASFEGLLEDKEIEFMYYIFKTLFSSYSRSPYKTSIYINRVNDFVQNLRLTHNNLYLKFKKAIEDYTSNSDILEFIINDFVFWSLTNIPRLLMLSKNKYRILIFSDLGKSHVDFLETIFLNKLYNINNFIIVKTEIGKVDEYNINDFDIVLTSCTNFISEKSIIIDDFPNLSQIALINLRILEIIGLE